ncbi:MAG: DEAD/DEAH box helicase [Clostridium sp.]|uniref:DEAD/DEAH box helicase n=1 Tax=Clostridium sp. TaxID=1506 RepID=UPI0030529C7B
MMKNFQELGINCNIINSLKQLNIITPTRIQEMSIEKITQNLDIMMQSETGSGKTLAYLLPLIEKINYDKRENQFIVLVPTHELALQVNDVLSNLAEKSSLNIKSIVIMGDVNIKRQVEKLKDKPQFVIGSPGRILELIKLKKISAHAVKTIVIDECDKLLDRNNYEVVKDVIKTTLKDRQLLMTSATLTEETITIGKEIMKSPEIVKCNEDITINPNITHLYIVCDKRDKILTIRKLMASIEPRKAIAFINKTDEIQIFTSKLQFHGLNVDGIHGSFMKNERQKAMNDFKSEKINLLVSSDLSARGLDIPGVTHIFNIDLPEDINTYLHRSGRTARGENKGTVISIVSPDEIIQIKNFSNKFNFTITEKTLSYGRLDDVIGVIKTPRKNITSSNNKNNLKSNFKKNSSFNKNKK